jgi:hypothetical protein
VPEDHLQADCTTWAHLVSAGKEILEGVRRGSPLMSKTDYALGSGKASFVPHVDADYFVGPSHMH